MKDSCPEITKLKSKTIETEKQDDSPVATKMANKDFGSWMVVKLFVKDGESLKEGHSHIGVIKVNLSFSSFSSIFKAKGLEAKPIENGKVLLEVVGFLYMAKGGFLSWKKLVNPWVKWT
ncbi:hypothetical protein GOBAR_DD12353 [Gossypium barbadense]|nr:hypothetical protein GOBAR_DD12353 [Gossypium barbadense]